MYAVKFYLDRVVLHQPFFASENQKHWATRLRRPHPSVFPRFDTILECDGRTEGRTDRRTDGFAVAYTTLVKLALRRAVKTGRQVKRKKKHSRLFDTAFCSKQETTRCIATRRRLQ